MTAFQSARRRSARGDDDIAPDVDRHATETTKTLPFRQKSKKKTDPDYDTVPSEWCSLSATNITSARANSSPGFKATDGRFDALPPGCPSSSNDAPIEASSSSVCVCVRQLQWAEVFHVLTCEKLSVVHVVRYETVELIEKHKES